jgi:hypothetical protein
MTQELGPYLLTRWSDLKQNPIFLRRLSTRGFAAIASNPVARMAIVTLIGLGLYHLLISNMQSYINLLLSVVFFWWFINVMHYYFVWLELHSLSRSGTFENYLNSGMSRGDVVMGLIQPGKISKMISQILIVGYFLITIPNSEYLIKILLGLIIYLEIKNLWSDPNLFLPDVRSYFRARNPLALMFIGLDVFVPLIIWFSLFFGMYFLGLLTLAAFAQAQFIYVGAFLITLLIASKIGSWIDGLRAKSFYRRYPAGLEQLMDEYIGG